jgi:hypothetical protein
MHRTHQPCKQIWAHTMPNGPLWQSEKGQPHLKPKKNKYNRPNVRINILNEGYFYTMKVLQNWIKKQKLKMKVLLKPRFKIGIE